MPIDAEYPALLISLAALLGSTNVDAARQGYVDLAGDECFVRILDTTSVVEHAV